MLIYRTTLIGIAVLLAVAIRGPSFFTEGVIWVLVLCLVAAFMFDLVELGNVYRPNS